MSCGLLCWACGGEDGGRGRHSEAEKGWLGGYVGELLGHLCYFCFCHWVLERS